MAENRTKRVIQDANFTAKAAADAVGALAFMVMASFGVSLVQIVDAIKTMVAKRDAEVVILCIDAGVQIRGNVTFVTANFGGGKLRADYNIFLINSQRETGDDFNFSALHAAGHAICVAANTTLAQKVLSKAGNCINGSSFPTSPAGRINSEIKSTWTEAELSVFSNWVNNMSIEDKNWLATTVESIADKAAAFGRGTTATATSARAKAAT